MKPLEELTRKNIWEMTPYSCARNEYSGSTAHVFLDANESPYNRPYNRYPDPLQREVKKLLSKVKGVAEECIFLGNGSDEAIDLVYRCFATPGVDNVVAIDPTYGMYAVCAQMNDIAYRTVSLDERFQISAERLLEAFFKTYGAVFHIVDVGAYLIHTVGWLYCHHVVNLGFGEAAIHQVDGLVASVAEEDIIRRHTLYL